MVILSLLLAVTLFFHLSYHCVSLTHHTHNFNLLSRAVSSRVIPSRFASTQMFAHSPFTHLIGLFKTEIWMGNSAVPSNPFPPNWNGWH